jgi:endonuclease/exonuclease/phosphatase family metal-dependent hydrolase
VIRVRLVAAVAAAAAVLGAASVAQARGPQITLMSRNLFIGGDYTAVGVAPPSTFPAEAGKLWRHVIASDPPARLKLVAAEVARANPDVLAVQEAALWRTGPVDGYHPDATHVVYDFVAMLQRDLAARHLHYRLVARQSDVDVEGNTDMGIDVRIGNSNAIFVRRGLKVSHAHTRAFRAQFAFQSPTLGPVALERGYAAADVTVGGRRVRIVDTHLEAYSTTIRADQARELVAGPLRTRMPAFLIGDLNSGPNLPQAADRDAYRVLARAHFFPLRPPRPSCCLNDDLKTGVWNHAVDWILGKPRQTLVRSYLTGRTRRTPRTHLHASDHGGIVSVIRLR